MKLYNLFKEVILETTAEINSIQDTMNKNLGVNISYADNKDGGTLGKRYCQVLAIGTTSKGTKAIRVYQISGPNLKRNKKGQIERWKTFDINKILSWEPTNFTFYAPPDELYNALGDKTLNIPNKHGMANMAVFGDKNLDKYRERHANWQSSLDTKQANEPLVRNRKTDDTVTPQPSNLSNQDNDNINKRINTNIDNDFKTDFEDDLEFDVEDEVENEI